MDVGNLISDSSAFSKLLMVFNFLLSYPHTVFPTLKPLTVKNHLLSKKKKEKREKGKMEGKFIHVIYIFLCLDLFFFFLLVFISFVVCKVL